MSNPSATSGRVNRLWYRRRLHPLLWLLVPLNWLFIATSSLRRAAFRLGLKKVYRAPVPVVVVGNISVGGTGKTPLILALVDILRGAGYKPGIVARGYGGQGPFPQLVTDASQASQIGDEPLMLHQVAQVPVCVSPNRGQAAAHLLANSDCNIILSDDGLQHYALARDIEIAVVDQSRGLGNAWRLPCGPLRESPRRLKGVDYVVLNQVKRQPVASLGRPVPATIVQAKGVDMTINALGWRRVTDHQMIETPDGEGVIAIAGIGNPQRFFNLLEDHHLHILETRVFADHHAYQAADFHNVSNVYPLVMTEKDAVKCRAFARPHWYFLKVGAILPESFKTNFLQRVQEHIDDA